MIDAPALPPEAAPRRRHWLAPAIWLSGRLSFSRKYLLVGAVMGAALGMLSVPVLQQTRQQAQRVALERDGLAALERQGTLLSLWVTQRQLAMSGHGGDALPQPELKALRSWATQHAPAGSPLLTLTEELAQQAQALQGLARDPDPQRRFAAHTATLQKQLALMRETARAHRLNVDDELETAFDMLGNRLPLLIETLARQQDALALPSEAIAGYALGAQVVLSESMPALRAGIAQLQGPASPGQDLALTQQLDRLLAQIERQQEAVDKLQDGPAAAAEVRTLASANREAAQALLQAATSQADRLLQQRLDRLQRTLAGLGAILLLAMGAIAYLFAGIYVSTLRSLRRLSQGTQAFCAGQLNTRVTLDTQDELVQVARNFNTVADEVGRLLDVIREQNESRQRELERLVQVRTLELADKNHQLRAAALRVQEELASARAMQQAILPQDFPDHPDYSMQACMHPARELGGDFYDCFRLPGGRIGFLVADVAGKGVGAAFFMAVSRTVLQDLAESDLPPDEVFARANELLAGRNPMELFVTACFGQYDPRDGSLVYASAGHPAPLLRQADGQVRALPCPHDLALGVMPGMSYEVQRAQLSPGDTLLLYTDGITEAFDAAGEAFGDARLLRWLGATRGTDARALLTDLTDEVARFVGGAEASDDLTCLLLCRRQGTSS